MFKILKLIAANQLKNHQVVLSTHDRSDALLVLDLLNLVHVHHSLDISGDGFLLESAETDINVNLFVVKSDNGYL